MRKKPVKRKAPRAAPLLNVGPSIESRGMGSLIAALTQLAEQAIVLGRTEIGVEAIRRLGEMGAVRNVSITNSSFQG